MNYSQKTKWKLLLVFFAVIIVAVSLWYSNELVRKIETEERAKVHVWADAIQRKARLVKYANDFFNQISNDERKKVQLWADATKMLASPTVSASDLSFIFELVKNNENIPVTLTDEKNHIVSTKNLPDSTKQNDSSYMKSQLVQMRKQHEPIEID